MGRRPTQIGHAPPPLTVVGATPSVQDEGDGDEEKTHAEDERTTVDDPGAPVINRLARVVLPPRQAPPEDQWEEGTTVEEPTTTGDPPALIPAPSTRTGMTPNAPPGIIAADGGDEVTVEDTARPLPPLSLVPPVPPARTRPAEAKLVVIAGNDTGKEFPLPHRVLTVGRAVDNDIVLTDIAVSRKHFELAFEDGGYVLRDRGSGNGTLVNDRVEDGTTRLRQGDRVEIGNTVFRFELNSAAPATWGPSDEEASTVDGRGVRFLPDQLPAAPSPAALATMQKGMPRLRPVGTPSPPSRSAPLVPPVAVPAIPTQPIVAERPRAPLPPPGGRQRPGPSQPPPVDAARLVLPSSPPGATTKAESESSFVPTPPAPPPPAPGPAKPISEPPATSPAQLAAMSLASVPRHLTSTALVEPRPYESAAGGTAPVQRPYPYVLRPLEPRRRFAVLGAVVGGAFVIGMIAMIASSDDAKGPTARPVSAASVVSTADWGTDETVLTSRRAVVAPVVAPTLPGEATDPTPPSPAITVEPPRLVVEPETPEPIVEEPRTKPESTKPERTKPERAKPERATKPERTKPERITKPERTKEPTKPAKGKLTAVRKKAAGQYAAKDWKGAANTLRSAALDADDDVAGELEDLADTYESVGAAITQGNTVAATRPTEAMAAYNRALSSDKRAGGGLAAFLRDKLGQVAPKAAGSFMARGNYEAARRAADTAVNYGAGSSATVTQVRQSLERKAGDFYGSAMRLMADRPADAKALLRRILKIVPPDSAWYTKASKALSVKPRAN